MKTKNNKTLIKNKIDEGDAIVLMAVFILLIAVFSFNFAGMGITGGAITTFPPSEWTDWLIGDIAGLALNIWAAYAIYIVIFLMLAAAFSDIFSLATPFSTPIAWVLGIGLAIIAVLTGLIRVFAHAAFVFAAGFGTIAVVISLIIAFVVFLFASKYIARLKIRKEAQTILGRAQISAAELKGLRELAKGATSRSTRK